MTQVQVDQGLWFLQTTLNAHIVIGILDQKQLIVISNGAKNKTAECQEHLLLTLQLSKDSNLELR